MQKSFVSNAIVLAAAMILSGTSQAQQAPATKTPAAAATPAAKAHRATTAKSPAVPLALTTQKDKFSYALGMKRASAEKLV